MSSAGAGLLPANILGFARALRAAGLAVGTGKVLDAVEAACTVGVADRDDFYWSLHAALVNSPDQQAMFAQAFQIFFANPQLLRSLDTFPLPQPNPQGTENPDPGARRLSEALAAGRSVRTTNRAAALEWDAPMSYSDLEVLQHKDFEQMSVEELHQARQLLKTSSLLSADVPMRRFQRDSRGTRVDMRATLRAARNSGGQLIPLIRGRPRRRRRPLVLICDISRSMGRYSRMFLHLAHSFATAGERVHAFVFATHLTHITRHLSYRDVDEALARVSGAVTDWSGGTRIGECIRAFNFDWSRRVLAQGAIVLFLSDGLERAKIGVLAVEMERLRRSCHRLIWLNPLLRYQDFEPRAQGVRQILPHVDEFRPAHNIKSLQELGQALRNGDSDFVYRALHQHRLAALADKKTRDRSPSEL